MAEGASETAHVIAPLALTAGNRNITVILVVLAGQVVAQFLIFVAGWHFLMYLTPSILVRLPRLVACHV